MSHFANSILYSYTSFQNKRQLSTSSEKNDVEASSSLSFLSLKQPTEWQERWFLSSNAKDIGTLYLMFALFSGLIGTAFSVLIRLELSAPGVQYIADNQLYNSIITAHAIMMIFFMVKFLKKLNIISSHSLLLNNNNNAKNIITIGSDNNNNYDNNNNNYKKNRSKHKYTKIFVEDPYNNRHVILKMTKKQKGIYIWETLDGKHMYIGHSINLYNRINSYFMPSILKTKAHKVLPYLNKYGFIDMKLHIYIMDENSSLEQVMELEQYFIDSLKLNLNVDLVASSSEYHEPASQEIREKLRKQRGIPIYMYNIIDLSLIYIFDSKQYTYDCINIHHKTLSDCLNEGSIYLDNFFFSLDLIEESTKMNLLSLEELKSLVNNKREIYIIKHPKTKTILAEFKDEPTKSLIFDSLNSLASHLKGDRQVIRSYLKGDKSGYYRGKWKFYYQDKK